MQKELLKSKTFWTGISSIVGAAAGFFTGTIDASAAINMALLGFTGIFLRDSIAKK